LVEALKALASQYPGILVQLAVDRTGGRVLEAAMKPGSCLDVRTKCQLIETFCGVKGGVQHACLSPAGGWVVSAMAAATSMSDSTVDTTMAAACLAARTKLQEKLAEVGETLKKANPAVRILINTYSQ
jgi:hypothetical protein